MANENESFYRPINIMNPGSGGSSDAMAMMAQYANNPLYLIILAAFLFKGGFGAGSGSCPELLALQSSICDLKNTSMMETGQINANINSNADRVTQAVNVGNAGLASRVSELGSSQQTQSALMTQAFGQASTERCQNTNGIRESITNSSVALTGAINSNFKTTDLALGAGFANLKDIANQNYNCLSSQIKAVDCNTQKILDRQAADTALILEKIQCQTQTLLQAQALQEERVGRQLAEYRLSQEQRCNDRGNIDIRLNNIDTQIVAIGNQLGALNTMLGRGLTKV